MRGRKQKPTHIKLLQGSRTTKARIAKEPKPVGDLFEAPEYLTEDQKIEWAYIISNAPAGLLKKLDRSSLENYVVAADIYRQAVIAVNNSSLIVKSPVKGDPMQNPYLPIVNKQAVIMMRAAAELGFTPTSRCRITIDDPNNSDDDTFDDF